MKQTPYAVSYFFVFVSAWVRGAEFLKTRLGKNTDPDPFVNVFAILSKWELQLDGSQKIAQVLKINLKANSGLFKAQVLSKDS